MNIENIQQAVHLSEEWDTLLDSKDRINNVKSRILEDKRLRVLISIDETNFWLSSEKTIELLDLQYNEVNKRLSEVMLKIESL